VRVIASAYSSTTRSSSPNLLDSRQRDSSRRSSSGTPARWASQEPKSRHHSHPISCEARIIASSFSRRSTPCAKRSDASAKALKPTSSGRWCAMIWAGSVGRPNMRLAEK
jgi:hypothetical protein